jgi:hypothetical protein
MKRVIGTISLSLIFCLAVGWVASAHKYHTSVTRLEYNPRERAAEITIQTFTDDLKDILDKRTGKNVRLDAGKDANRLAFEYLRDAFELKYAGSKVELQWVGMEVKGETAWLYALAKMPHGLARASLRNALLFDLFDDQVNIVNILHDGKKSSLVFKHGDGAREIP